MRKLLVGCLLAAAASTSQGDTLLIEGLEASAASTRERPGSGMSMARVEAQYGAPAQRVPAVGEPPIARWEYTDFTVFFERELVIHSVARH